MKQRSIRATLLGTLFAIVGCATADPVSPDEWLAGFEDGSGLRTNATSYVLEPDWVGLKTVIGIRFTNPSPQTMYIVNCRGGLGTTLEKRVNGAWVPYWAPVLMMCLSEPIIVKPGETLTRDVPVWGALPGNNAGPEWASANVEGTYRMVLGNVVWNYTTEGQRFGDPVPQALLTSNEFTLRK
jgi:hypothetical protein